MYCVVRRDSDEQRCDAVRYVPANNSPAQARVTLSDIINSFFIIYLTFNFKYFTLRLNTI